ncbi:hypothetical protein GCM10010169_05830 [Micromonospora fulviviridis]|nr:hypothetical protein GCM10010169_05830 [Micromonospora fulviviridis]
MCNSPSQSGGAYQATVTKVKVKVTHDPTLQPAILWYTSLGQQGWAGLTNGTSMLCRLGKRRRKWASLVAYGRPLRPCDGPDPRRHSPTDYD